MILTEREIDPDMIPTRGRVKTLCTVIDQWPLITYLITIHSYSCEGVNLLKHTIILIPSSVNLISYAIHFQIFNGVHMLGLKRLLHNRWVWTPSHRHPIAHGDSGGDLVHRRICAKVKRNYIPHNVHRTIHRKAHTWSITNAVQMCLVTFNHTELMAVRA